MNSVTDPDSEEINGNNKVCEEEKETEKETSKLKYLYQNPLRREYDENFIKSTGSIAAAISLGLFLGGYAGQGELDRTIYALLDGLPNYQILILAPVVGLIIFCSGWIYREISKRNVIITVFIYVFLISLVISWFGGLYLENWIEYLAQDTTPPWIRLTITIVAIGGMGWLGTKFPKIATDFVNTVYSEDSQNGRQRSEPNNTQPATIWKRIKILPKKKERSSKDSKESQPTTIWERVKILFNKKEKNTKDDKESQPTTIWERVKALLNQDLKADNASPPPVRLWFLLISILTTFILVVATLEVVSDLIEGITVPNAARVPGYLYIFGALGTVAYLFTNIATNQVKTFTPLQATARFCASFPIVAGVFALHPLTPAINEQPENTLLVGSMFLAGFAMEVYVQTFNLIARRLFALPEPPNKEEQSKSENNSKENKTG